TSTRDPVARPAPRLCLGRSGEGNVWAMRRDVDSRTREELQRLCSAEPRIATPCAERGPECRKRVCELLAPVEVEDRGPSDVLPWRLPQDERAREVEAGESGEWFEAWPWLAEEFEMVAPVAIAFQDGQAAAVCHSPRGLTTMAAEAGVQTLEPFRG